MKIAIIGPSPVPFTVGGVENLLWGLCNTINQLTPHQCELIKLPSKEYSFWELIENYYQFYQLDVSHFDAVICTKYPAWMVQHPNCIFYVQHCLRGLYDTYHFTRLPLEVKRGNQYVDSILDTMKYDPNPFSLDAFFAKLFDLKNHLSEIPADYFRFPGPFIRLILKYLDHFGLSQNAGRPIYCISKTVKARAEYFPNDAKVETVYHPSYLKKYHEGEYQHVFMVSRLDGPKRIDVLIQAMKYVSADIKLLIAGTGPMEAQLKKMAEGDERIKFLGFVNDEEVARYYADSLVIPYFPYDEDYGLITVEAMMHKKPVITTVDAGGPTEFVVNGETGYITELDPKEIGKKIDYFSKHPEEARRMGQNAYEQVRKITWERVVGRLLETLDQKMDMQKGRKKITVTSTFPIYPPMGGGQSRTYHLYRELARAANVEIVSYTNFDQPAYQGFLAKGLQETRIPREQRHQYKIWKMEEKAGIPLGDIAEITLGGETKAYRTALEASISSCDLCVMSHPYLYPIAKKYLGDRPYLYEAQDIEFPLKQEMLPQSGIKESLVQQVFDTEKACCENAKWIMTCSEEDRQKLHEIYHIPTERIIVVPNGVDTQATPFIPLTQRLENKKRLHLEYEKIGLFMGSWHGPNLEACEMIFDIARNCPDTSFMLMGSQCAYFEERAVPDNVAMLGVVSEEVKNKIFGVVDFALNPMRSGSGTNLKMFDYMSAGIPIITTTFGTRGIADKSHFLLADTVQEMTKRIRCFQLDQQIDGLIQKARKYAEDHFDWGQIVKPLRNVILNDLRESKDL